MKDVESSHALYSISVASELSGVDPQMLRIYEQRGLIRPFRTAGGTRRYSRDDLDRIAEIISLLDDGLNLAGIGEVLKLRDTTGRLAAELGELKAAGEPDRRELRRLRQENDALKTELARRDDSEEDPDLPQDRSRPRPPLIGGDEHATTRPHQNRPRRSTNRTREPINRP